jgi:antigen flippase
LRLARRAASGAIAVVRDSSGASSVARGLIIRIAALGINFATGVLVARSLGPSGRGEQAALALWPTFLAVLATMGIPTALTYHARRKPRAAGHLFASSVVAMVVLGLAAAGMGALLMPSLMHGFSKTAVRQAQWLMLFAPASLVAYVIRAYLEARGKFTHSTLSLAYPSVLTLVALAALRLINYLTPLSAALSYMVPLGLQSLYFALILWNHQTVRLGGLVADVRRLIPYGLRCYGSDVVNALAGQMDLAVIVAFLSPAQLGLYTVALSLSRLLNVAHASLVTVLFSRASGLEREAAIDLVARGARLVTIASIAAGIVLVVFARVAVPFVYGRGFTATVMLLPPLTAEAIVGGLCWVLFQGFLATNKPAIVTGINVAWVSAAIALLFVLVPRMNVAGAAYALLIASGVKLVSVFVAYSVALSRSTLSLFDMSGDLAYVRSRIGSVRVDRAAIRRDRAVGQRS